MNRSAKVTSIQAISTFRAALIQYQEILKDSLSMLSTEAHRGLAWVQTDRIAYWPAQIRESSDELAESKNALIRKQLAQGKERGSCYEEKKAIRRAKQRLRYCESRFANSKHWLRLISHDADEFQGLLGNLSHFVDSDLPKAIAKLETTIQALDKYASELSTRQPLTPRTESERQ